MAFLQVGSVPLGALWACFITSLTVYCGSTPRASKAPKVSVAVSTAAGTNWILVFMVAVGWRRSGDRTSGHRAQRSLREAAAPDSRIGHYRPARTSTSE